jgi:hypothetical protein
VTTLIDGGWQDPGSGPRDPGSGRHRRGRRLRLNLLLIDPPSATGLPPGQLRATPLRRTRGRTTVAIAAGVALGLSALAGVSFALPSAHGPASFPRVRLLPPLPSATGSGQPRPTASPTPRPTMPARNDMTHGSKMPVMTPPATPSPTMIRPATPSPTMTAPATPSAMATPSASATQPTVAVIYRVVSERDGGLVGEVKVINTGYSAISRWQLVVALPYDQFTAVSDNASGYASHHILLLQPATYADSVPAEGTLSVFFAAYGTQTTPEACAFNDISCR